jgi:phosphoglycolate phosphatase-like HAD superfamily hydrolase
VNYTHLVFDIDGTLLDTKKPGMVSLQQTSGGIRHRIAPPDLIPILGIPSWEAMIKLGFATLKVPSLRWKKIFQRSCTLPTPSTAWKHTGTAV